MPKTSNTKAESQGHRVHPHQYHLLVRRVLQAELHTFRQEALDLQMRVMDQGPIVIRAHDI